MEIEFGKPIYLPTNNPEKVMEIELTYKKGGMNVFTYQNEKRGYYVSVIPMQIIDRGGYKMHAFTAFSGAKYCIRECSRKSVKAQAEAVSMANGEFREFIKNMIADVAKKNDLEVKV